MKKLMIDAQSDLMANTKKKTGRNTLSVSDKAELRQRTEKLIADAGFPKKHRRAKIEPRTSPWFKGVLDVLKMEKGFSVAICGPRGGGKTQMSYALAVQLAWKGQTIQYTTAVEIYLEIKESYTRGTSEKAVLNQYLRADTLIIDELQERSDSDWADQLLTFILDKRYGAEKNTILISNLKPEQFMEHVGPSIADRITETGAIIEANWPSFRVNKS